MVKGFTSNMENCLDYCALSHLFILLADTKEPLAIRRQLKEKWMEIEAREQASRIALALPHIKLSLSLTPFQYFRVFFSFSMELDGSIRNKIQQLTGYAVPTFDFAAGLYTQYTGCLSQMDAFPQPVPDSFLFYIDKDDIPSQPLLFTPLLLRRNLISYLNCVCVADTAFYRFIKPPALPIQETEKNILSYALTRMVQGENSFALVSGKSGSGKKSLIARAAKEDNRPCLLFDCRVLEQTDFKALRALSWELVFDAMLSNAVICYSHVLKSHIPQLETILSNAPVGLPLFVTCDESVNIPLLAGRTALCCPVGLVSKQDYQTVCASLSSSADAPYYRMTVSSLFHLYRQAEALCAQLGSKNLDNQIFAKALQSIEGDFSAAVSVLSNDKLTGLVLSEDTAQKLSFACNLIRWDIESENPEGVTILFYGPSGTGKTMSASAISNELGLELFKIDLSRIMDKYIGETEKHLASLFAAAKDRNCILFFDEADALFSKRTEVSSSHDRYANSETAYLLQSIEQYNGPVLLATNLFKNFDEAFLRRITLTIHFSLPEKTQRLALWQKSFDNPDVRSKIDLDALAEEWELSPALIKETSHMAASLARAEIQPVSYRHIEKALSMVLSKYGKSLSNTTLYLGTQ